MTPFKKVIHEFHLFSQKILDGSISDLYDEVNTI